MPGSPVFYEAYATSASCANGINAMRIYTAPGVNAYTVDGDHIEAFIPLKAGTYSTVVQAWDNCGGVAKTPVNISVNSNAGVSVFLPSSSSAGTPVHVVVLPRIQIARVESAQCASTPRAEQPLTRSIRIS